MMRIRVRMRHIVVTSVDVSGRHHANAARTSCAHAHSHAALQTAQRSVGTAMMTVTVVAAMVTPVSTATPTVHRYATGQSVVRRLYGTDHRSAAHDVRQLVGLNVKVLGLWTIQLVERLSPSGVIQVSHQLLRRWAILIGMQVLLRGREHRRRWRRNGAARRSRTRTRAAGSTGGAVAQVATALLIGRRCAGAGLRLLLLLRLLMLLLLRQAGLLLLLLLLHYVDRKWCTLRQAARRSSTIHSRGGPIAPGHFGLLEQIFHFASRLLRLSSLSSRLFWF